MSHGNVLEVNGVSIPINMPDELMVSWAPSPFDFDRISAVPVVIGSRHDDEGWRVTLLAGGLRCALTAEEAGELAKDLTAMVEICEGRGEFGFGEGSAA